MPVPKGCSPPPPPSLPKQNTHTRTHTHTCTKVRERALTREHIRTFTNEHAHTQTKTILNAHIRMQTNKHTHTQQYQHGCNITKKYIFNKCYNIVISTQIIMFSHNNDSVEFVDAITSIVK